VKTAYPGHPLFKKFKERLHPRLQLRRILHAVTGFDSQKRHSFRAHCLSDLMSFHGVWGAELNFIVHHSVGFVILGHFCNVSRAIIIGSENCAVYPEITLSDPVEHIFSILGAFQVHQVSRSPLSNAISFLQQN
jgi:hypothetical protein